jgi:Zn-dependent peptidase ImmA (M78 family)
MPAVNPVVLEWARETAGLQLPDAAAKLQISSAQRLAEYEAGERQPSSPLLKKMAKTYRRPLITFYLSQPPIKGETGEDFRNLPQRETPNEPLVEALLRDVAARQAIVRSVLEDEEAEADRELAFIGSRSLDNGFRQVLSSIEQELGLDRAAYRAQGSADAAFAYLRNKAEAAGVFVLLIGNLGTWHTNLEVSAFRGFALADPVAPFVVINDQDAKSAWPFTLLHELAHLWIGATGVSGAWGDSRIERFCNDVASEFLLPAQELPALDVVQGMSIEDQAHKISEFAGERFVSRSLVAYRLFLAGRVDHGRWLELAELFRSEWRASRDAAKERARARDGGPNYYVVRRHRLGASILQLVDRALGAEIISPTRAAKVLGVKPRSVSTLLQAVHQEGG